MTNCNDGDGPQTKLVVVPDGGLWDAKRVAEYLQVSTSWVWKQVRTRAGLPFIGLGGRNYRFDPEAVRRWVRSRAQFDGEADE